jgi:serine-type D-Ala-D-Ala carboxypeptidase (penicillin-binding protein 5/6)
MTALIVLENYDLDKTITITEEAFHQDLSRLNNLYFGEQYKVKEILYPLLMESSNTAAYALAQQSNDFVDLMNQKAQELGMTSTFFINSSGLDPLNPTDTANYSSARDIALLIENLLDKEIIWEILSLPEYPLVRSDGFIKHNIVNTNALLQEIPGIMGGKTGTTARALQCFVLVMKKNPDDYLIIVVLGSRNRFQEAKEIISWINNGYYWEII